MWALSFIVPGLSSSTLLVFFGLYEPMLVGISKFSGSVILPLAIGTLLCLILVSRAVKAIYERWHSQVSHTIIGVVLASMIMVIPFESLNSPASIAIGLVSVICGAAASLLVGKVCNNLI
jgi:putative membrane protein